MLASVPNGTPFSLGEDNTNARLPPGLRRPIFGVPASSRIHRFAVALYGRYLARLDRPFERLDAMLGNDVFRHTHLDPDHDVGILGNRARGAISGCANELICRDADPY